jgi:hypothetical protein
MRFTFTISIHGSPKTAKTASVIHFDHDGDSANLVQGGAR